MERKEREVKIKNKQYENNKELKSEVKEHRLKRKKSQKKKKWSNEKETISSWSCVKCIFEMSCSASGCLLYINNFLI